jgi:hypothetical protein
MATEWLFQTVDIPLWGIFVLTAYSARRLASAVGQVEQLRRGGVGRIGGSGSGRDGESNVSG